jgi:hypothetical protein
MLYGLQRHGRSWIQTTGSSGIFAQFRFLGLFLFGDVKRQLKGQEFEWPQELQKTNREVLRGYQSSNLTKVFDEWAE